VRASRISLVDGRPFRKVVCTLLQFDCVTNVKTGSGWTRYYLQFGLASFSFLCFLALTKSGT
jgi:hypothetical protein